MKQNQKKHPSEELIIGLVGPTGSRLDDLALEVKNLLKRFHYDAEIFKATDFFKVVHEKNYDELMNLNNEAKRINKFMDWGNELRETSKDIMAQYLISRIHQFREEKHPIRQAYILKSLKHPDEVNTLRDLYKDSFYLIALWADKSSRKEFLKGKQINEKDIKRLIDRDEKEAIDYGQQQVKTFHLADVFIQSKPIEFFKEQIDRFLNLLFGYPFVTPSWDEHCMFLAYSASLRSSDLSRQVGAVVVSEEGDVIAEGCNEVPKYGGGQYKNKDNPDVRDFQKGYDYNEVIRNQIIKETLTDIQENLKRELNIKEQKIIKIVEENLKNSKLKDLTEFGRSVHAEMEALLSAGRSGVSVRGGTMYVTTFPCHNCAKHIITSGLKKVFYIEPYPKSQAFKLHGDAITDSVMTKNIKQVQFLPFIGLGPRKYFDLFSTQMSTGYKIERKNNGETVKFESLHKKGLRLYSAITSYSDRREKEIIGKFKENKNQFLKSK